MNKKFTPTPHDTVFKKFLGEKEVAKDFFSIWLPDEIKSLCDLDSLKLEAGSFVDSKMKITGVIFSTPLKPHEEMDICIL